MYIFLVPIKIKLLEMHAWDSARDTNFHSVHCTYAKLYFGYRARILMYSFPCIINMLGSLLKLFLKKAFYVLNLNFKYNLLNLK